MQFFIKLQFMMCWKKSRSVLMAILFAQAAEKVMQLVFLKNNVVVPLPVLSEASAILLPQPQIKSSRSGRAIICGKCLLVLLRLKICLCSFSICSLPAIKHPLPLFFYPYFSMVNFSEYFISH
jgi:hypothetical protein